MAIIEKGNKTYVGAVIGQRTHYWLDGMVDEYSIVYDKETNTIKEIQTGYIGGDGYNFMEMAAQIDLDAENARAALRVIKEEAKVEYAVSVAREKKAVKAGRQAEVIRGRKVKKGTILKVFWIGERPTYFAQRNPWSKETEMIAGCYDEAGNKVWIKAEYLKNITEIKSPSVRERNEFIKAYVHRYFPSRYGIYNVEKIAMGGC